MPSRSTRTRICFSLAIVLLMTIVPVSQAAIFLNPEATVSGKNITVRYTVTGASEGGIESTLLVMKKTESTGANPPESIGSDPDFICIDQRKVTNGENTFSFPIGVSFQGETLRIYIGGNNGTNLVFTDVEAIGDFVNGISVSGRISSYNPQNITTLKLLQGGVKKYAITIPVTVATGQVIQDFSFEDVEPGVYTLEITKALHTKFMVQNVIVGNENVDLTTDNRSGIQLMSLRCGDINSDGMINDGDLTVLWRIANYNKKANDSAEPLCDLNGDGMINDGDLTILWMIANYNKGAVFVS